MVRDLAADNELLPDRASVQALERRARELHTLTAGDQVQAVSELLGTLGTIDQFTIERLHLVEHCRQALLGAVGDLVPADSTLIVPLDEHSFVSVNLLIRTLQIAGSEYEGLANLLEEANEEDMGENASAEYREAFCMHRYLELLDAILLVAARSYLPAPTGVWCIAHGLIERSMALGALDFKPPTDPEALGIGDIYAVMLLTALADPFRLSADQNDALRRFAAASVDLASLRLGVRKLTDEKQGYQFGVDFDLDVPALPWRASRGAGQNSIDLILDVTELVLLARRRQLALKRDPAALDDLLEACRDLTISYSDLEALYKHLVVEWGKQPIRKASRKTLSRNLDVLVGFRSALHAPLVESRSSVDTATGDGDAIVLVGGTAEGPQAISAEKAGVIRGQLLDVSSTGIRLRLMTNGEPALQVGEVLAWRDPQNDRSPWKIGVVRWLQSARPAAAEAGVLIFGEVEDTATLQPANSPGPQSPAPVIVVAESPYRSSEQWVIAGSPTVELDGLRELRTYTESFPLKHIESALKTSHITCLRCIHERTDHHEDQEQDIAAEIA